MKRCRKCNMPLSEYNRNPMCFWHYTIKPDKLAKNVRTTIRSWPDPDPQPEIRSVKGKILATNPKVLANMTILEIASKFDCNKPSVYNVMSRNGLKFRRLRPGRQV